MHCPDHTKFTGRTAQVNFLRARAVYLLKSHIEQRQIPRDRLPSLLDLEPILLKRLLEGCYRGLTLEKLLRCIRRLDQDIVFDIVTMKSTDS